MKTLIRMLALGLPLGVATFVIVSKWTASQPSRAETTEKLALPPLPADVTELKFSEFFVMPVGDRGLVLTEKLLGLHGKRVRMIGYMVHQEEAIPGQFIFSPIPVQLHSHDSSDDLPSAITHVFVPTCQDARVPFAPGLMLLTGTLSVGAREEADGRISLVRLALDPPDPGKTSRTHSIPKRADHLVADVHQR